ncbi:MAG TPA: hypothetical protein VHE35_05555, partial [Kofleriaceae bacterium]|nr:hypothetical protein [Kofleriaceae bacterium]
MTRWTFPSLFARLIVDGSFRTEAIVFGPEHLLTSHAAPLSRALVARIGAGARDALLADLRNQPPPAAHDGAGELTVPADAVAANAVITVPADARADDAGRGAVSITPIPIPSVAEGITPIPIPGGDAIAAAVAADPAGSLRLAV